MAGFVTLKRFAEQLTAPNNTHCSATPVPEVAEIEPGWKSTLREAMTNEADWRSPQIVVPRVRRDSWDAGELVNINFDACDEQPGSGPHQRVLAILEAYEGHPFALSDFDPWDFRHLYPPPAGAPPHRNHPCCLPRPPLEDIRLDHLAAELANARRLGWKLGERFYFIPHRDWHTASIDQASWRNGRAFPYRKCRDSDRSGYIDYEDREWVWDREERHWDIQLRPHVRVRHTGELVP
jgi:hypothetical protein